MKEVDDDGFGCDDGFGVWVPKRPRESERISELMRLFCVRFRRMFLAGLFIVLYPVFILLYPVSDHVGEGL
jgi:hypothetical protein